ncbi:MAG: T9SS type A sorting domain-containing protein [Flavobacteriales bacterium]
MSTAFDDYIYVSKVDYDVREYPVYQGGQLKTHMVSVRPTSIEHYWRAGKNPDMQLYLPLHENGNILSYPNPDLADQVLAGLGAGFIGTDNYGVGAGQNYTWTVGYSDMSENSSNLTRDMSLNASLNASAYGAEVGITGSYSTGSVSTHTSSLQQSITCTVDHQSFTASAADAPYSMRPYMSWGADGSLLVDYLVEPQEPSFGTQNYWSQNYSIQDPAWNLPWRLEVAREFVDPEDFDESKSRVSKSFWMTDYHDGHQVIYPHPGDTVVVHARVFNYSLEDTEGAVPVSFFIGHPLNDGLMLTDLDGNTIVYTDSYIPAQWYKEVSFAVVLPSADVAPDARLYGVIDPQQQWTEVHEINNYGWVALGPHFPLIENEVVSVEEMNVTARDVFRLWPNPANDQFTVQASGNGRMDIVITDLSGRQVSRSSMLAGAMHAIDLNDIAAGVYIVTLSQGARSWSQRLVVE